MEHDEQQEPEAEPQVEMSPAVEALLQERQRINDALRAYGYTDPEVKAQEPSAPASVVELKPLRAVPAQAFKPEDAKPEDAKPEDEATPQEQEDKESFIGTLTPIDSNIPADAGRIDWNNCSEIDRQVIVALAAQRRDNIDGITNTANTLFGGTGRRRKPIQPWTVRRALYGGQQGGKSHNPEPGTLMQRGLVEQTDPFARGKIQYKLTLKGEAAMSYARSLSAPQQTP